MFIRSSIVVVTLFGAAGAAAAQTPMPAQVSQETLRQVQVFEVTLRAAVEKAGAQVGELAKQAVPDIMLRFETQPRVTGVILPEGEGVLFLVEVPGIEGTSAALFELSRRMAQNGTSPLTRTTGTPVATPPVAPPAVAAGALLTNPEREYSEFARQALMDAMLDYAFALPLKDTQSLTLSVGVASVEAANPLAPIPRRLYLRLKGEDLMALRQNRITRDQAKTRIMEFRY